MSDLKKITINGVIYYVTPGSHIEDRNNPHDITASQVGAAPSGYGLGQQGSELSTDDASVVDSYKKNGWVRYYNPDASKTLIPNLSHSNSCLIRVEMFNHNFGVQTAHDIQGNVAERVLWDGAWNDWCIRNPQMAVGVEYRTTERYQGAVVYKKVDANGNILWRKENETRWRLLSTVSYVD